MTYNNEYRVKSELLSLRYNERLQKDMSSVIEDLPEGVIIFNNDKTEILMANQEARRLLLGTKDMLNSCNSSELVNSKE